MKIFIELPTWLGDAVMTTPALENLANLYPQSQWILFGSPISLEALETHPQVIQTLPDTSRQNGFRLLNLRRLAQKIGPVDLALSFRRTFTTDWILWQIHASKKARYRRLTSKSEHQVLRYNRWINHILKSDLNAGPLRLYHPKHSYARPTFGINPGATYGSAKRWYPEQFAQVAQAFADRFDLIIFGGPGETQIAQEIQQRLLAEGVKNITNLAGKTSVKELISHIGGLDLFLTNDSGPMHVAAAYHIPTVALFGPTNHRETSPWSNPQAQIVRHSVECAPCMKRTCPLGHHNCMRLLESSKVIEVIKKVLNENA